MDSDVNTVDRSDIVVHRLAPEESRLSMGVTQVQYKIAECDICGKKKEFRTSYSLPEGWNEIKDDQGYINYTCVCDECTKRVADYIRELRH